MADLADDTRLEIAVEAASRAIDGYYGWHFLLDSAATTRYYTAEDANHCHIDPMVTLTSIATDPDLDRDYDNTWVATDYDLEPYNAATDGRPYRVVRKSPLGRYNFPTDAKAAKVVATFGWAAVPIKIKQATLILAERYFRRKDAPFGVTGSAETGMIKLPGRDPDVADMVDEFRLREVSS